jgi:glycosyltransferase involved in cell wall biosynthesis
MLSKKVIKIGVDITDLKFAKTGQKTFLESICHEFDILNNDKYIFHYFTYPFTNFESRNTLFILLNHLLFQFWKQILLPIRMNWNKCDILFCADYYVPYFHIGFKSVQVIHDAFFLEYPTHYNKYWLYIYKILSLSAARKSTFIITPTEYAKIKINQYTKIPLDRIIVISEGPKSFNKVQQEVQLTETIKKITEFKYILHVGVFEKRKNLLFLLKAFNLLIQSGHSDYKLVLVGKGTGRSESDDTPNILNIISDLELSKNIILTGYVSDCELAYIYKNANMYVFPSYNEGFGIPILEAFQFGLPVLVADNTCLPEVGGNGVITFNPFNTQELVRKMTTLIEDNKLRQQLIQNGQERLKLYSWEKTAHALLPIFDKTSKTI